MSPSAFTRLPSRRLLVLALAAGLSLAAPAMAQSTGATLRGQVNADSAPAAGARITATNLATGAVRSAQVNADGSYLLPGLVPGQYRVVVQTNDQRDERVVSVAVGQTATLNLAVGGEAETASAGTAQQLDTVQVSATALVETKTSELATYVSNRQIEALPQGTRNFLAFADTVPGMIFEQNPGNGATRLRAGAQSANNINVYIDGVGQKNYVIQGGITGQDSSRGNPFPQLAIGEYKVITSNYKAEYDQISSAAVTAVTRSGTNDFSGSFFWDTTNQDWRTAREDERGGEKTRSSETQYGMSVGGPIIRDRLHFFTSYEAKEYNSPKDLVPGEGLSVADMPAWLADQFGSTSVPFKEDLYFGKLSWTFNEANLLELSFKKREELGVGNVGGQSAASFGTDTGVDEDRYDLRWQYSSMDWLNDAHLTWEDAYWSMAPVNFGNGYQLTDGSSNNGRLLFRTGAGDGGLQDKGQEGWSLQNDTTYFGFAGHTLKFGVKYKQVELNTIEQQPYNPQFYYDIAQGGQVPYYVSFGSPVAGTEGGVVRSTNKQFGIYLQDDWEVSDRLTLNLGLRWDYEKTPAWSDFVTGADVLTALATQDPQAGAPAGQTYAQSLAAGGIDVAGFISTGSNRKAFRDAWQPRLGFSYDLSGDERHVLFGGIGRAYDRNLFDYLQLERTKATFPYRQLAINSPGHACDVALAGCVDWDPALLQRDYLMSLASGGQSGREVWMFANDLKVPYSDQISLGIRNAVQLAGQQWNTSLAYQFVDYNDGLLMLFGNRQPDGSYFNASGSPWSNGGVPGMGNLILGTNNLESRSHSLLFSADKPYTAASPWSVNLAYTYTSAEQNVHEQNPAYGWFFPAGGSFGGAWTPRHRLVLSGFGDLGHGLSLSGKLTLASHLRRWDVDGSSGYETIRSFQPDGTIGFKQFDLSLARTWDTGSDVKLKVRADVLNVFDWQNWGGYGINWRSGEINRWDQYATRTFKLSFGLDW
jgi:outer membrane receptor protein involved in Fe transport